MTLNKKIFGLLFLVLVLTVLSCSFFLIKASVEDKQNYIFDLQTTNGLLLARTIKGGSFENIPLQDFPGIATMGVGVIDHRTAQWVFTKPPEGEEFPQIQATPSSYEVGGELATSIHDGGFISTYVPLSNSHSLVIVSRDDPIFQMLGVYLKRTLPLLFLVLFLIGVLSWLFSRKVSQPLESLSLSTEALGEGNWDVEIPDSSTREIQTLANAFKKMGVQLKKREQELIAKERLSALGQFAAGMAHELKNPLNVISSYAQLIERASADQEKTLQQVEVIRSEVDRAAKIINDLMSFARQKPLELQDIEIRSLLDEILHNQKVAHPEISDWSMKLQSNEMKVKADRDNLRQVLINLTENAAHALEGRDPSSIEISVVRTDDFDQIIVKDNGTGIPEDILPNIFEPFYTTKSVGQGTGLGLAFCKGILQQHHGDLVVESTKDGTIFTIKLPQ